jgi:hypothetical protein
MRAHLRYTRTDLPLCPYCGSAVRRDVLRKRATWPAAWDFRCCSCNRLF